MLRGCPSQMPLNFNVSSGVYVTGESSYTRRYFVVNASFSLDTVVADVESIPKSPGSTSKIEDFRTNPATFQSFSPMMNHAAVDI